jgi:Leucine-rich repeat (LRR) protein
MKKFCFLFIIILFSHFAYAQYVTIPDTAFRAFLQQKYPSCFNGEGMMNSTCSAIVNETSLDLSSFTVSSLDGIQYFTSLRYLNCINNIIFYWPSFPNTLDTLICDVEASGTFPGLPNSLKYLRITGYLLNGLNYLPDSVEYLNCSGIGINSLPVLPNSLSYLDCSNNNFYDSLPTLPNSLTYLNCSNDYITLLTKLPNSLTYLNCSYNNLYSLPALPNSLTYLNCSNNTIFKLPALPPSLIYLDCSETGDYQLDSLPALPNTLTYLNCAHNTLYFLPVLPQSLKYLNCSNASLAQGLPILPGSLRYLNCSGDAINSLPALPGLLDSLDCSGSPISILPTLPGSLKYLNCSGEQRLLGMYCNPDCQPECPCTYYYQHTLVSLPFLPNSLTYLDCSHDSLFSLPPLPVSLSNLHCEGNNIYCLPQLPASLLNIWLDLSTIHCLPNSGNYTVNPSSVPPAVLPLCNTTGNVNHCPYYPVNSINVQLCPPISSTSIISDSVGAGYQWQVNTGSGFNNISNGNNYEGSTTNTLNLINISSLWYGYQYQCIVSGNNGAVYTLQFADTWTGAVDSSWEKPANWSCGSVPDANTDVIINNGTIVLNSNTTVRSLLVNPDASFTIAPGFNLIVTH